MAASSLSVFSLRGLELTLADSLAGRSGPVVVPAAYFDLLAKAFPSARLLSTNDGAVAGLCPDVLVLDELLDRSNAETIIAQSLSSLSVDGEVIAQLAQDFAPGLLREQVTERLARVFPSFSFRLVDLTAPHWVAVRARKPVAWLILGASKSGKTSSTIELAQNGGSYSVHGDALLEELALGLRPASAALKEVARLGYDQQDWSKSIKEICDRDLLNEFLAIVAANVGNRSFFLDIWLPIVHRHRAYEYFSGQGYFVFQPDAEAIIETIHFSALCHRLEAQVRDLEHRVEDLSAASRTLTIREGELLAIRSSRSWNITRPLRQLRALLLGKS